MAYYDDWGFKPYVPVAERRRRALLEAKKSRKKGETLSPVHVEGRTIARTFWGKAWCDNLEQYSDYSNRLPRGRTYVRNGSVIDLQISAGVIKALISGSSLYKVSLTIQPVSQTKWKGICRTCSGSVASLVDLLQGRLSEGVMERICRRGEGLFPAPKEIRLSCSCPDWADMCKHVAAALYGVGARLDYQPELLFLLRGVDERELIAAASQAAPAGALAPAGANVLGEEDLSELFGLDMATAPEAAPATPAPKRKRAKAALKKKAAKKKPTAKKKKAVSPTKASPKKAVPKKKAAKKKAAPKGKISAGRRRK